ncbi:hypothetical protein AB3S75_030741 [Citrus x aurantiifolia]
MEEHYGQRVLSSRRHSSAPKTSKERKIMCSSIQQNVEVPQKCLCLCFDCTLYDPIDEFMASIDRSKNSGIGGNSRKFNPSGYDGTFNPAEHQGDSYYATIPYAKSWASPFYMPDK